MENIKLICFDLNETLLNHNSWKKLGISLGVTEEEDRNLYLEYKRGALSYDEWNNKILECYLRHDNATREGITEILSRYEYNEGARESVDYLKSKGYKIVLISGSIDIMVSIIAHDLGIQYYKANNDFIFDGNNRLVAIHSGGDDVHAKLRHLESFCELLEVSLSECACIGDGDNDIELFKATGHGVTFRGKDIEKDAWKIVDTLRDLKNIF